MYSTATLHWNTGQQCVGFLQTGMPVYCQLNACGRKIHAFNQADCMWLLNGLCYCRLLPPSPYPIVLYEWTRESECKHLIAVVCLFEVHANKIGPTHTRHTPLWSHFSQHWLHICWSPFQLPLPPHRPQSWVSWLHQGNPTYNKVKPSSVSANRPSGASSFSSHSWPN